MSPDPLADKVAELLPLALNPKVISPLLPLAVESARSCADTTPVVVKSPFAETCSWCPTVEADRFIAVAFVTDALPLVDTPNVAAFVARVTLPLPEVTETVPPATVPA